MSNMESPTTPTSPTMDNTASAKSPGRAERVLVHSSKKAMGDPGRGKVEAVNFLVSAKNCEQEGITDLRDWLTVRNLHGSCGLHIAVRNKQEKAFAILLKLIKQERDFVDLIDQADSDGMNAMLEACKVGSMRMVTALCDAGSNWTSVNNQQKNGRDLAIEGGHDAIIAHFDQGDGTGQEEDDGVEAKEVTAISQGEANSSDEETRKSKPSSPAAANEKAPASAREQESEADDPCLPEIDEHELQDRCDLIHVLAIFGRFGTEHIEQLARGCVLRKYRRTEAIFGAETTDEERACLIFVLSGEVRILKECNDRHDEVLEEGDTYGERALVFGEIRKDLMNANTDCYIMFLPKSVLKPILQGNPQYAESISLSLSGNSPQDAQTDSSDLSSLEEEEHEYVRQMQERIVDYYEIPIIEAVVEDVDRKARKLPEVPLLDDMLDSLTIRMKNSHDFGIDDGVNHELQRAAAGIDQEYLYQYVEACRELGTAPLPRVMFQLRHHGKVINLQGMQITAKDALALSAGLSYMEKCEGIDLSHNPIFDAGCVNSESLRCCGIVNAIALNTCIKTVILSRTRISRVTASTLGRFLPYHGTITRLDLSNNDLRDEGIEALASGLKKTDSVRDLNLSNVKCSFSGATSLGTMFRSNQTLEVVNFSWNNFALDKGSASMLQGMAEHPKIEEVHLEWNFLGPAGGVALGQLLRNSKTVKKIDVSHCQIPESATDSICAGLTNNSVLENLRLQFNPLKNGVPRIKDAMFANKNWQEKMPSVRLDHCEFEALNYHAAVVNSANPSGHYKFDLSKPHQRKDLEMLITLATLENGENWRNETLDGVRFHYPHGEAWGAPAKGILELDFVHLEKSEDPIIPENHLKQLTSMINQAVSSEVRMDLVKQACNGFRFMGEDAMALMYSLNRTPEREETLVALFSKLCGREAIMPKILLSCFNRREVERVQHRLGTYYVFDSYRPEGRYRFDLGKKNEIDALSRLIYTKQKIPDSLFKFVKLQELKSRTDWKPIEKVEVLLEGETLANPNDAGILELEFSIPETAEANAHKKMFVQSEIAQLERSRSLSKSQNAMVSLATLGFEYDDGPESDSDKESDNDETKKSGFDFAALMNRTRAEYKIVSVLHPDMAGIVKCTDMNEKPFNSHWDGGKTTMVVKLEDHDQKCLVQILTPRGTNEYSSAEIRWNSPFKTIIDIGKPVEEIKEEDIKRQSSAMHEARLKKFNERKNSPAKLKTVPKKGGKGLRPVEAETFPGVKSLDFTLALSRSKGYRMFKPWTGFVRSDPADFKIESVNMKSMTQHKVGGVISKRLTGALGPSSCANYVVDLSMSVTMHTIPRYFSFLVKPSCEMNIYVSTKSLPWENDYMWKGELTEAGERVVNVRPTDRNYRASKYYVSIVSCYDPGDYECFIEISPYQSSLKNVESLQLPRFGMTKNVKHLTGLAPPKRVAEVTSQNSKVGKMLSSLMMFTEERKSKSCFGAAVPGKAIMSIRGQSAAETTSENK